MKGALTLISMSPFYGGGEEFIVRLVDCLQEEFEIHVIFCAQFLSAKLETKKVQLTFENGSAIPRYCKVFFRIWFLPYKRRHVLLLNGQGPGYFALFLPKIFKKIVFVQHTSLEYFNVGLKRLLVIFCLRRVDSIICVSSYLKNEIEKYIKTTPAKVIWNWLPEKAAQTFPYNSTRTKLKLIFIGRLVEAKGILPLIRVVDNLADVELEILGDGPLYDNIKNTYSNSASVHLLGWQGDVSPFLKEVQLNVVNSSSEGFSYTPIEAGVRGIPSLISDIDSHKEISENGTYAFLFKTGDAEDLKNKLIYLKNNRKVLEEMSGKCKAYFTEKFVLSNYKEQYIRELS